MMIRFLSAYSSLLEKLYCIIAWIRINIKIYLLDYCSFREKTYFYPLRKKAIKISMNCPSCWHNSGDGIMTFPPSKTGYSNSWQWRIWINILKYQSCWKPEYLPRLNFKFCFDGLPSLIIISSLHQVIQNKSLLRLPTQKSRYGRDGNIFRGSFKYFPGDSCNWKFEKRKELLSKNCWEGREGWWWVSSQVTVVGKNPRKQDMSSQADSELSDPGAPGV